MLNEVVSKIAHTCVNQFDAFLILVIVIISLIFLVIGLILGMIIMERWHTESKQKHLNTHLH